MELTFEDLACKSHSFRVKTEQNSQGKVVIPRRGVICKLGDLTEEEWIEKMEYLITEADEWQLNVWLVEWVKGLPWVNAKDKEAVRINALEIHSMRLFDNELWVDFVKFNHKYRPEILENTELVKVVNDCCGKVGLITRARFEKPGRNTDQQLINCCPHCGRWSTFREAHPDAEVEMEKVQVSLLE